MIFQSIFKDRVLLMNHIGKLQTEYLCRTVQDSMKAQLMTLYGTLTNIRPTTGASSTNCFVVVHNNSERLSRSLLQLLSRRRSSLCSLTASGLDHYMMLYFELIFMVFEVTEH